jgi:dienelactone hydrolase
MLLLALVPIRLVSAPAQTESILDSTGPLARYFKSECETLSSRNLADILVLKDWASRRDEYRRQLQEMLGLWPMPEKTPLHPVLTGKIEHPEMTVEKLHFQASPGLYVTANLYLPRGVNTPAPGILYVCGHSRVVTNGASCGNKTGYQHHGAWFARHGYVCLTIDTLQLGEIEGTHHGTYRENQWWWNSRGYTPAGVEAWFGIRALDYLCSRPEVDSTRIGMTGRSGGGSYTWTVAALDDRVRVAAPVAGITDLQNHVVDGAVDGHCDCMFYLNTYRWDFPTAAALLAPRPLLICNTDKDKIFPLDGVIRLHNKVRRIYELYGASTNLGLLITEGPHADTQDLQVPVFRWFDRFLKGQQPPIEKAAVKFFAPLDLKVFDQTPADQINTRIQDRFVCGSRARDQLPAARREELVSELRSKVFNGWPATTTSRSLKLAGSQRMGDMLLEDYDLASQENVNLKLYLLRPDGKPTERCLLTVVDAENYTNSVVKGIWLGDAVGDCMERLRPQVQNEKIALAFLLPRLVDHPEINARTNRLGSQIRRRYMLLGQTLEGMRVWDIRVSVASLRELPGWKDIRTTLVANGNMGVNAMYAALFEADIAGVHVMNLPASHMEGPDYLNVLKYTDIPEVMKLLGPRLAADKQE